MAALDLSEKLGAIALSGGGDSVALMLLLADWAEWQNCEKPAALIVDHGLREGSAKDAAIVADWAKEAGFSAHILRWSGAKPRANVENKAREARYRLLGEWCLVHQVSVLFVAHTEDDQAETFLLRLGRGSGVDGLSAMQPRSPFPAPGFPGIEVMRPLLSFGRAELRTFLKKRGAPWFEDPMNSDPRFQRVRIRAVLPALEAAGVPAARIAAAACHLSRARESLEVQTERFLATHARLGPDSALLDGAALMQLPLEIGLRALSRILMRVSGEPYRPRFERLSRLFEALRLPAGAKARTLHGCQIGPAPKAKAVYGPATLMVGREGGRRKVSAKRSLFSGKTRDSKGLSGAKPSQKGRIIPVSFNS